MPHEFGTALSTALGFWGKWADQPQNVRRLDELIDQMIPSCGPIDNIYVVPSMKDVIIRFACLPMNTGLAVNAGYIDIGSTIGGT